MTKPKTLDARELEELERDLKQADNEAIECGPATARVLARLPALLAMARRSLALEEAIEKKFECPFCGAGMFRQGPGDHALGCLMRTDHE